MKPEFGELGDLAWNQFWQVTVVVLVVWTVVRLLARK